MRRVPVLREDDVLEVRRDAVNGRDDGIAVGTASAPPGQKSFCTSMTRRMSVEVIFIWVFDIGLPRSVSDRVSSAFPSQRTSPHP